VKFNLQSLFQLHVRVVGCFEVVEQRNKIPHLVVVAPLASSLKRFLAIRSGALSQDTVNNRNHRCARRPRHGENGETHVKMQLYEVGNVLKNVSEICQ